MDMREDIMTYITREDGMGAVPEARQHHTKYRELTDGTISQDENCVFAYHG